MTKSKFDFVSVIIVAACVLALIFLIYKTINMYNQNKANQADIIEQSNLEEEEADLYNKEGTYKFDDDGEIVTDKEEGSDTEVTTTTNPITKENNGTSTDRTATNTNSSTTTKGNSKDPVEKNIEEEEENAAASNNRSNSGAYLVLAGSFRQKANASTHAAKLRKMGYEEAEVSIFNRGAYATVLVDRFEDQSEARSLVGELKNKGVEAIVITKK